MLSFYKTLILIKNIKKLITGGGGFIGPALIRHVIKNTNYSVLNIDRLTYGSNINSLNEINLSN